ncbi:MAG: hypothetical protein IIZ09_14215 [Ruminococcus sp.]|nr:hypothetical protein [Ruminococcus sp.]
MISIYDVLKANKGLPVRDPIAYHWGRMLRAGEKKVVYGIRIDPDTADPYNRVTYLEDAVGMTPANMGATAFDYGSWAGAFFMPKPCVLNYDGAVAYYLDPNDYSKKIDGTPSNIGDLSIGGNVMLEFPKIYFKYVPNANGKDGDFYVANYKVDDTYECWCNYDADNNEIDHFYMAAYNGCCYDGKMRSISGLALAPYVTTAYSASATYAVGDKVNYQSKMYECITAVETAEAFDPAKWQQFAFNGNTDGVEEMAYARANNTTAKDEWLIDLWADAILIWGLLMLIGKSTAVQETFGRGIDSGSQGTAEAYITGSLNDKGLFYGSTANGSTAVKVFGIENFWGCKWRRCAGFFGTSTGYAYKLTHGAKDGSAVSSFGTTAAGYLTLAYTKPSSNYVKNMNYGKWGIIAKVTDSPATSNNYYCDYFNTGTGFALFGGASNYGPACGVCVNLAASVGYRAWTVAAAPSCKPLKSGDR